MPTLLPLFALLACSTEAAEPLPDSRPPEGFWRHWGDGRAELTGYALTQPRYGSERSGEAVLIFVTEDFTLATRVKSDGGHGDEFPVIKLNETRDFQTGIYDYNTMTSSFVRLDGGDPLGVPSKISFSSAEWCGHTYEQLLTHRDHYTFTSHSYFDGEADRQGRRDIPRAAVFLDAMPIYVRGLAGEIVPRGGSRDLALHGKLLDSRFSHSEPSWVSGTLARSGEPSTVEVPAGRFEVETFTLEAGSHRWTYAVELAPPHRLIRWTGPRGEEGAMTGSIRSPYWTKSQGGQEKLREALGLGANPWAP